MCDPPINFTHFKWGNPLRLHISIAKASRGEPRMIYRAGIYSGLYKLNVAPGSEAPHLFFEESECSLARFSITGLALWVKLMIFLLSGSKLMQVHVCLWDRLLWEVSLHQELVDTVGRHIPTFRLWDFVCTVQSCRTFQRKPSTVMHISRLELSCLLNGSQSAIAPVVHSHNTERRQQKKERVGRRRIQTSIKCSYITVCANGHRLTDNVFLFQQKDACFYWAPGLCLHRAPQL